MADDEKNLPATRAPDESSEEAPSREDVAPTAEGLIPAEVMQRLPPQQREQLITAITTMLSVGPMPNPIASKMTTAHITKVLDLQEKEMGFTFSDRRDSRLQSTVVFLVVLALGVLVILVLALNGKEATLRELLPIGAALAGGFGSGFAVGRHRT